MLESGELGSNTRPLTGSDEATIDDKGRILVSKKKRDSLGPNFVMAIGETGCIVAYPEPVWSQIVSEIRRYSMINQGRHQFGRLLTKDAEQEMNFDTQGRVVIPRPLRTEAQLTDKVMIVGVIDRLEIWSIKEWEKYNQNPDTYNLPRREAIEKAYKQMVDK